MKKYTAILLALVLTAGMLAACRRMPDEGTVIPSMTDEGSTGTTQMTDATEMTDNRPSTDATTDSAPDNGNGMMPDAGTTHRNSANNY